MAYSVVYNCDIDLDLVNKIMPKFIEINDEPLTTESILEKVCAHFDVSREDICSKSRKQPIVYIRQLAMYLANKHTDKSTSQIGHCVGGRNHATVIHSIKQIKNLIDTDERTRRDIEEIESTFFRK